MAKKQAVAEEIEYLSIGDLIPDPVNPRQHTPRNIGIIVDSLHTVGAARSIVIDEDNVVQVGNGTVEAGGEAGITRVKVVEADGDEIVAVRRRGLTNVQKLMMKLADNRAGELAGWDKDVLNSVKGVVDLSKLWTDKEFSKIPDMALPEIDQAEGEMQFSSEEPAESVKEIKFSAEQWEVVGMAMDNYRSKSDAMLADSDIITAICESYLEQQGV